MMPANEPQPSVTPSFSLAERDRRWSLTRAFMDREDLDAMLVFGEHEDAGPAPFCFDTWFTNGRAGTTILFVRTVGPIIFAPMQSYLLDYVKASQGEYPNWTAAENVRLGNSSGEIGDALKELGLARARIGVIGLEPYVPWHPEGFVPYNLWKAFLARSGMLILSPWG
jgi:hypothetical protein